MLSEQPTSINSILDKSQYGTERNGPNSFSISFWIFCNSGLLKTCLSCKKEITRWKKMFIIHFVLISLLLWIKHKLIIDEEVDSSGVQIYKVE